MKTNNTNLTTGEDNAPVVKKKRGRKPNPNKPKMYFSDKEEEAFKEFITCENEEKRNKIFNNILYPAFTKMVESIIRKYTLFKPGEEFEDTFNDVMSHLISKIEKFDPSKNTKAYSYCGTICKHYALHERQKAQNRLKDSVSYEMLYNENNPDLRITENEGFNNFNLQSHIISKTIKELEEMLTIPTKYNLNENDVKVGVALVDILKNWDDIFSELTSKKYNKNQIELFIKEYTSLDTKQIRISKKKFSNTYFKIKEKTLIDLNN